MAGCSVLGGGKNGWVLSTGGEEMAGGRRKRLGAQRWGEETAGCQTTHLQHDGLNENPHTATKTKNKVESGLLLDVIVRRGVTY
jgi:hypothetical protein